MVETGSTPASYVLPAVSGVFRNVLCIVRSTLNLPIMCSRVINQPQGTAAAIHYPNPNCRSHI